MGDPRGIVTGWRAPTDIDASPLTDVRFEPAFTQIEEIERAIALVPLTDGTERLLIPSQKGNIYVIASARRSIIHALVRASFTASRIARGPSPEPMPAASRT